MEQNSSDFNAGVSNELLTRARINKYTIYKAHSVDGYLIYQYLTFDILKNIMCCIWVETDLKQTQVVL